MWGGRPQQLSLRFVVPHFWRVHFEIKRTDEIYCNMIALVSLWWVRYPLKFHFRHTKTHHSVQIFYNVIRNAWCLFTDYTTGNAPTVIPLSALHKTSNTNGVTCTSPSNRSAVRWSGRSGKDYKSSSLSRDAHSVLFPLSLRSNVRRGDWPVIWWLMLVTIENGTPPVQFANQAEGPPSWTSVENDERGMLALDFYVF